MGPLQGKHRGIIAWFLKNGMYAYVAFLFKNKITVSGWTLGIRLSAIRWRARHENAFHIRVSELHVSEKYVINLYVWACQNSCRSTRKPSVFVIARKRQRFEFLSLGLAVRVRFSRFWFKIYKDVVFSPPHALFRIFSDYSPNICSSQMSILDLINNNFIFKWTEGSWWFWYCWYKSHLGLAVVASLFCWWAIRQKP